MAEILFVIGFFFMLLMTGISLLGILAALAVATLLVFIGGLFTFVIKLLPWLLLALVTVWIYRTFAKPPLKRKGRLP